MTVEHKECEDCAADARCNDVVLLGPRLGHGAQVVKDFCQVGVAVQHAKLAAKASKNFHQRALVEWLTYSVEVEYAEA